MPSLTDFWRGFHAHSPASVRDTDDEAHSPAPASGFGEASLNSDVLNFQHKPANMTHVRGTPFTCTFCGRVCRDSWNLKQHIRSHTGEKPPKPKRANASETFQCDTCGKCFAREAYLTKHTRAHTGEKPFACDHCGQHFGHESTLRNHKLTHTREKRHKCDDSFSMKHHLDRHMETSHSNKKNFQCFFCKKDFVTKQGVDRCTKFHLGQYGSDFTAT